MVDAYSICRSRIGAARLVLQQIPVDSPDREAC